MEDSRIYYSGLQESMDGQCCRKKPLIALNENTISFSMREDIGDNCWEVWSLNHQALIDAGFKEVIPNG